MNFVEKLFKQHPFVYCIGGKYYAFGTGVCSECNMNSVLLESRYINFEQSLNDELTRKEAWEIFHKLMFEAECVRSKNGICKYPEEEILKFSFSPKEMNELEYQVTRYIEYWKKYEFNTPLH